MTNLCFKNKTKINHFIIKQKYICEKRNIFFVLKHRLKSFYIFFSENLGITKSDFYKRVASVIKGCDNDIQK